jgi:hypothetical protein
LLSKIEDKTEDKDKDKTKTKPSKTAFVIESTEDKIRYCAIVPLEDSMTRVITSIKTKYCYLLSNTEDKDKISKTVIKDKAQHVTSYQRQNIMLSKNVIVIVP